MRIGYNDMYKGVNIELPYIKGVINMKNVLYIGMFIVVSILFYKYLVAVNTCSMYDAGTKQMMTCISQAF